MRSCLGELILKEEGEGENKTGCGTWRVGERVGVQLPPKKPPVENSRDHHGKDDGKAARCPQKVPFHTAVKRLSGLKVRGGAGLPSTTRAQESCGALR